MLLHVISKSVSVKGRASYKDNLFAVSWIENHGRFIVHLHKWCHLWKEKPWRTARIADRPQTVQTSSGCQIFVSHYGIEIFDLLTRTDSRLLNLMIYIMCAATAHKWVFRDYETPDERVLRTLLSTRRCQCGAEFLAMSQHLGTELFRLYSIVTLSVFDFYWVINCFQNKKSPIEVVVVHNPLDQMIIIRDTTAKAKPPMRQSIKSLIEISAKSNKQTNKFS